MNRFTFTLVAALAAGALALIPDDATGCAAVWHGEYGPQNYVSIADESAVIIWDDKAKTEHFVRRANFRSTGYDFGFLVPTPSKPELEVADDNLFHELATITAPKVEYREVVREVEKDFSPGCALSAPKSAQEAMLAENMPAGKAGGVEVLEQKRVGDYDAAVLAFRKGDGDTPEKGAAELEKWLAKHGYEAPPAVREWLKKYVADQWCVTAFKIAQPEPKKDAEKKDGPQPTSFAPPPRTARDLRAKPIRMSFKAERPFYPYREPETEPNTRPANESRLLRVFVAAQSRFAGKLGDGSKPWPGQTVWAGAVDEKRWERVFEKAKLTDPPTPLPTGMPPRVLPNPAAGYWLTEFEDKSSPRPGTDEVYFEPSADKAPVERPPNIITTTRIVHVTPWWHAAVYFGVPALLIIGGLVAWRVAARRA